MIDKGNLIDREHYWCKMKDIKGIYIFIAQYHIASESPFWLAIGTTIQKDNERIEVIQHIPRPHSGDITSNPPQLNEDNMD